LPEITGLGDQSELVGRLRAATVPAQIISKPAILGDGRLRHAQRLGLPEIAQRRAAIAGLDGGRSEPGLHRAVGGGEFLGAGEEARRGVHIAHRQRRTTRARQRLDIVGRGGEDMQILRQRLGLIAARGGRFRDREGIGRGGGRRGSLFLDAVLGAVLRGLGGERRGERRGESQRQQENRAKAHRASIRANIRPCDEQGSCRSRNGRATG
jgi:hypothetical protein